MTKVKSSQVDIVPPRGKSAFLISIAAAAMAFVAVFALSLSLAVGQVADKWSGELARSATVHIADSGGDADAEVAAVLSVLNTTPGIKSAAEINAAEQARLLAPWLGDTNLVDGLTLPRLINVELIDDGPNIESLNLRLSAEVPSASFDDHGYWRRPVIRSAERMRLLAGFSLMLIAGTMAIIVILSANVSLATNESIIKTLRLIGAKDSFIARAFVRRITARATVGAIVGMVAAIVVLAFLSDSSASADFMAGLVPRGTQWIYPLLVPVFTAVTAYLATRMAAYRHLRRAA